MSNNSTVDYYIAPAKSFEATADAIRVVNGSTASLVWGQDGFADAIGTNRKYTVTEVFSGTELVGNIVFNGTTLGIPLCYQTEMTSFSAPNLTSIQHFNELGSWFRGCSKMTTFSMPEITDLYNGGSTFRDCTSLTAVTSANFPKLRRFYGGDNFRGCTSLTLFCVPSIATGSGSLGAVSYLGGSTFYGCTNLETMDSCHITRINGNTFYNCSKLSTLILRSTSVTVLDNVNVFTGSSIASGGSGCTIYIPKSLYDHLGDGTSNDYKAATNWATIDGYGTITWAKIEGSYYETHYADGTLIPTT